MKNFLTSLFGAGSMAGPEAGLQTIKVDHQHVQMGLDEGQVGESYSIKPASELELDASGYEFPVVPDFDSSEPTAIQLILDQERQYTVFWQSGVYRYTLNQATLIPSYKKFSGFNAGDKFVIAIGILFIDHLKKEEVFKVQWVGMGDVQS